MKGTRSFPQCGFSASVVNILNTLIPKYATVNVLADPDIRGGMKEYSDWPTFPQLFIKGEFVGGADIVRQMFEGGELEKKLGDLVAPAKAADVTVTPRAAKELSAALKEGSPGDVIHLTITPSWEHQLDIGAKEADATSRSRPTASPSSSTARARRAPSGVSIDFVEDATGAGFKIENPNRPADGPRDRAQGAQGAARQRQGQAPLRRAHAEGARHREDRRHDAARRRRDGRRSRRCRRTRRSRSTATTAAAAARAAEHFLKQGFKNVYNLAGGIDAWSQGRRPSVPRYSTVASLNRAGGHVRAMRAPALVLVAACGGDDATPDVRADRADREPRARDRRHEARVRRHRA